MTLPLAAASLLLQLGLLGFSPYAVTRLDQATGGVFVHKPTGRYVLQLSVAESAEVCKRTGDGASAGSTCKRGRSAASPIALVLEPARTTYAELNPSSTYFAFERHPRWSPAPPGDALAGVTLADLPARELTPAPRRTPCPVTADGARLVFRAPGGDAIAVGDWGHGAIDDTCFSMEGGWVVVRFRSAPEVVDGSSDGDSTTLQGWAYALVDASQADHEWLNTLGLRALQQKDRARARAYFERALRSSPGYALASYNLACALSLDGVPFADGRRHLEAVLGDAGLRARYLAKIRNDPDLAPWRADPAFAEWLSRWR
jgi:tetratricopeptide (TPR) repeat protein